MGMRFGLYTHSATNTVFGKTDISAAICRNYGIMKPTVPERNGRFLSIIKALDFHESYFVRLQSNGKVNGTIAAFDNMLLHFGY